MNYKENGEIWNIGVEKKNQRSPGHKLEINLVILESDWQKANFD